MNSVDIYNKYKNGELSKFGSFFTEFEKTAFRLELLQTYQVEQEAKYFEEYKKGVNTPSPEFNNDWVEILSSNIRQNKIMKRIRLLIEPLNDYTKFEINWGYKKNNDKGELIYCISIEKLLNVLKQFENEIVIKDFWLFDDLTCFILEYDFLGKFLGIKKVPDELTKIYVSLKNNLLKESTKIDHTKYWDI